MSVLWRRGDPSMDRMALASSLHHWSEPTCTCNIHVYLQLVRHFEKKKRAISGRN